jgi:hypothetical protein
VRSQSRRGRSSAILDGKAYKARLPDDADPDLVSCLCDPALLEAFAALENDFKNLRTVERHRPSGRAATLQGVTKTALTSIENERVN